LPDEPLVRRDFAVAYYLGLEGGTFSRSDVQAQASSFAASNQTIPQVIGGRPGWRCRQPARPPIRLAPDDAALYFELFEANKHAKSPKLQQQGQQALVDRGH